MTGTSPCAITAYDADRKSIPDYTLDATNLIKYNIGEGSAIHDFAFDFTPSTCSYFKTYEIEIVLKSDRSAVVNSFISLVEPIS